MEILRKDAIINKLHNNQYPLNLHNVIDVIRNRYSLLLNPEKVQIDASYHQKSEQYKISVNNVIGIFGDEKVKTLLLNEPEETVGKNDRKTDIVLCNSNFKDLVSVLDKNQIFFIKIGKSAFINLKFYDLENGELICNSPKKHFKHMELNDFTSDDLINFKKKKAEFNDYLTFQRFEVDAKVLNGIQI